MTTRIMIVDDHEIVRHGLINIINAIGDYKVICEAESGKEAIESFKTYKPDISILDITLPDMSGIEVAKKIIKIEPHAKILALSMHDDHLIITSMLKAGASGYLVKDCAMHEIENALNLIKAGKKYISDEIIDVLISDHMSQSELDRIKIKILSKREKEVLKLLAEGKRSKEISAELFISEKTVESHRSQIMKKLEIKNIADLTKFAIRTGLISLE